MRLRCAVEIGDRVVGAGEREGAVREEALEHLGVFDHAIDADLRGVHRDPRALVVEALPTGTDAHLESSFRQHVDARQLAGEHRRMAEVAVEHQRSEVDRGRHCRCHGERRDRPEALVEVVGNEEGRVAESLDLANRVEPRAPLEGLLQVDAEAKPTRM